MTTLPHDLIIHFDTFLFYLSSGNRWTYGRAHYQFKREAAIIGGRVQIFQKFHRTEQAIIPLCLLQKHAKVSKVRIRILVLWIEPNLSSCWFLFSIRTGVRLWFEPIQTMRRLIWSIQSTITRGWCHVKNGRVENHWKK